MQRRIGEGGQCAVVPLGTLGYQTALLPFLWFRSMLVSFELISCWSNLAHPSNSRFGRQFRKMPKRRKALGTWDVHAIHACTLPGQIFVVGGLAFSSEEHLRRLGAFCRVEVR